MIFSAYWWKRRADKVLTVKIEALVEELRIVGKALERERLLHKKYRERSVKLKAILGRGELTDQTVLTAFVAQLENYNKLIHTLSQRRA